MNKLGVSAGYMQYIFGTNINIQFANLNTNYFQTKSLQFYLRIKYLENFKYELRA